MSEESPNVTARMSFVLYDGRGRIKVKSGDTRLTVLLRRIKYLVQRK